MLADTLFRALKTSCQADWDAFVGHSFVRQLADGSLPKDCFRHYLTQDYIFLIHFSRAWALAVYKSEHLDDLRQAAKVVDGLLNQEMALHVSFCAEWGLSEAEMAATPEAAGNHAYTRFVLDKGMSGDLLDLLVALSPCVMGYAEIGEALAEDPATVKGGNPYLPWIETYAGKDYQEVARAAAEQLERVAARRIGEDVMSSGRWPALAETFKVATRLEIGFWDMGLNP